MNNNTPSISLLSEEIVHGKRLLQVVASMTADGMAGHSCFTKLIWLLEQSNKDKPDLILLKSITLPSANDNDNDND